MRAIILTAVLALTGCSTVTSLLPKDHDPVMFNQIVSIDIKLNQVNCSNKDWGDLLDRVHHLKVYTELRKDPQATNVSQLEEALLKAYNSKSDILCNDVLSINKTRVSVIEDAWRSR
jgi:hypothetical protein